MAKEEAVVETKEETEVIVEGKKPLKERFVESRPVSFVRRHAKGVVAGVAGVAAVGTAAVLAAKAARDGSVDLPFDVDGVVETATDAVEAVAE